MGRAPCCDKANVKRGPWSPEEDAKLKSYIEEHGTGGNWIALPQKIGLKRCGKSCRLRWLNYLRPNIKHGSFSEEEDHIICTLYLSIGSRWSIIAAQLPGRTDNDIKNYWNTRLKKKLLGKQRKEQPSKKGSHVKQEMIKKENLEDFKAPSLCMSMNIYPSYSWPPEFPIMNTNPNHQIYVKNQDPITNFDQYPFDITSTQSQMFLQNTEKPITGTTFHPQYPDMPYLVSEESLNDFQGFNNTTLGMEELVYNGTQLDQFDGLLKGFCGVDNLINGSRCTSSSMESTTPFLPIIYEDFRHGILQKTTPEQPSLYQ